MNKTKKTNKRNSKILQATMVTLGALKEESPALEEMRINEIQVHLLDEDGDGVVLCLEYETSETGVEQLSKTFSTMEEYYTEEDDDETEIEVELEESEGIESFIEEVISEEYDEVLSEIFHSNDGKPPLLN
jgi:HSP90 family molecular chaperone